MQCPLRYPLRNDSSGTVPCSDNLCSDDCSTTTRVYPFGVQFYACDREEQPLEINKDFWDEFQVVHTLTKAEKASASESVISFGVHKKTGREVFIKSFAVVERFEYISQGLLYEISVYEALRQLAAAVPHFINMVASYSYPGSAEFTNFALGLPDRSLYYLIVNNYNLAQSIVGPNNISGTAHTHHVMVTSKAPGVTIEEFFHGSYKFETIISVLFQILFCLHCMQMMGFQHNDLHPGNIFVDPNPVCKQGLYMVEGVKFLVPIPAKISIYDFDLSSCAKCGLNPSITTYGFCKKHGVCNERNLRFDMYTIFKHLELTPCGQIPEIKEFFKTALGAEPINEGYQHRFCKPVSEPTKDNKCEPFPFDQPNSVRTPIELLMFYFQMYMLS